MCRYNVSSGMMSNNTEEKRDENLQIKKLIEGDLITFLKFTMKTTQGVKHFDLN